MFSDGLDTNDGSEDRLHTHRYGRFFGIVKGIHAVFVVMVTHSFVPEYGLPLSILVNFAGLRNRGKLLIC